MSAAYEQTLDAFRAALGLDADAPIEAVMNELRSMPQPVVLLAIEVALGLLDDSAFCPRGQALEVNDVHPARIWDPPGCGPTLCEREEQ